MAAVTICSDFGAQEKEVYYCFHCFPIYFPWSDGETLETVSDFIFSAPKLLQMVIAALKSKDAYSLEEKLGRT